MVVAVYTPWYWLIIVNDRDRHASMVATSLSWKQLASALNPFFHPGSLGAIATFSRIDFNSVTDFAQSSITGRRARHAFSSRSLDCACFQVILSVCDISGNCYNL